MPEKKFNKRKHLVVLSGAGISAESGLKTFRDNDGLWMGYDVNEVASIEGYLANPGLVLDFYNMRRNDVAQAQPNSAHLGLASLESEYEVSIITQNVDDLHERAGSTKVFHLHGEIFKMCSSANKEYVSEIKGDINLGDLCEDGSQHRPFIVWFGEAVPMMETAVEIIKSADIFVIVGTSLQVYPAAGLSDYLKKGVSKYIIDPNPPLNSFLENATIIKKNATEGIAELINLLH